MFDAGEGWFFSRDADGNVRIEHRTPPKPDGDLIISTVLPPELWASVVASVSEGGDTQGRWQTIMDFHRKSEK